MVMSQINGLVLYLIVGALLLFISAMCVVFMVKSYRAGIAIGMDQKVLRRAVTSSVTFTVLPSISILLGVIALSGSLGIPLSWLRLSVVGALQYELNVADIAANAIGMNGLNVNELSLESFTTIALVMTVGSFFAAICAFFSFKKFMRKIQGSAGKEKQKKKSGSSIIIVAMFIGLCTAYIGAYAGDLVNYGNYVPLATAGAAALVMAVFEYFTVRKGKAWLENFSVATSMLVAMAVAVVIS